MRRFPIIARSLMFAAMALVVLVQSLALATLPVAPAADITAAMRPPCHQQDQALQDSKHRAMPCCDEEGRCNADDCSLKCYRAGAQFLGVPLLLTASAHFPAPVPQIALASALSSRQPIPPLPPPISA